MRHLVELLARFRSDESGVFAVLFGLMAIILVAMGGAAVDFASLEQTRSRAQIALDAAALALQDDIFTVPLDTNGIKAKANALMLERIKPSNVIEAKIEDIQIDVTNGTLFLAAYIKVPTIFVSLVGVQSMEARIASEATRKRLTLEVALVLDNSGSMKEYSRMTYLKDAAVCATNTLFFDKVTDNTANTCIPAAGANQVDDVSMAVVPFTMNVNVGATNESASWIDVFGNSPTANDNFDNDDNDATAFTGSVSRLGLFDSLTNESWRGCVEARPHVQTGNSTQFYDTDDTPGASGDARSLFVPLFAPDLSQTTSAMNASGLSNNYLNDSPPSCDRPAAGNASCTQTEKRNGCNSSNNNCSSSSTSFSFTGPQNQTAGGRYVGNYPPSCDCRSWGSYSSWNQTNTNTGNNRNFERSRTCSNGYVPTGLSEREYQERLCKYNGAAVAYFNNSRGPNVDCPVEAITGLTQTPAAVKDSINRMVAEGGTNIHEGTAWGFRTLSPTLPFDQGGPYEEATAKIMIVMTDGENTAYTANNLNSTSYHSAYGFPYNSNNSAASYGSNINRLGAANWNRDQIVAEMNVRTLQACTNAKAAGIVIYTIGLTTEGSVQSTPAVVRQMLTSCASVPGNAYFPSTPNQLKSVFQSIAEQLTALRIAR